MEAQIAPDAASGWLPSLGRDLRHAESEAWDAIAQAREPAEGMRLFAEWLELNREFREYQSQVNAMLLGESRRRLRESAGVLSTELPPPRAREEFVGHGSARWTVLDVTPDALEPHLFLARMYCRGGATDGIHDIYSEDWTLFCLVQGLQRAERQSR